LAATITLAYGESTLSRSLSTRGEIKFSPRFGG
jgi:hypothetical protein